MNLRSKILDLKADAHPGIPFATLGSTNSKVYLNHMDLLEQMVIEQLVYQVSFGDLVKSMSSQDLIQYGIWDPVRLFVKDEPHTLKKLSQGRVRLISNVSIRTQLIERVACSRQNNREIASWWQCPAKPGIGLDDESILEMTRCFTRMLADGPVAMTDISAWDWNVKDWLLEADAERRRMAAGAAPGSLFAEMIHLQAVATARSVYGLPDGSLVAQLSYGIQNSGSYKTSSTNSWMRIILRLTNYVLQNPAASDEELFRVMEATAAMGDDCVEGAFAGSAVGYEELGFPVKLCEETDSLPNIEFCSHQWLATGYAFPTSWDRTMYRFLSANHGDDLPDRLAQLDFVLRHHHRAGELMGIAIASAGLANKIV